MRRTIIAIAFLVTAACGPKPAPTVPSIYVSASDPSGATCYADGKSWPARVDGSLINCYSADMPKTK